MNKTVDDKNKTQSTPEVQIAPKVEKKPLIRVFKGEVVSDVMDKTIVVRVDRVKKDPKYKKRYKVSKKYKVHDEKNLFKVGDNVDFVGCRPLSKDKKWRVMKSLSPNTRLS